MWSKVRKEDYSEMVVLKEGLSVSFQGKMFRPIKRLYRYVFWGEYMFDVIMMQDFLGIDTDSKETLRDSKGLHDPNVFHLILQKIIETIGERDFRVVGIAMNNKEPDGTFHEFTERVKKEKLSNEGSKMFEDISDYTHKIKMIILSKVPQEEKDMEIKNILSKINNICDSVLLPI